MRINIEIGERWIHLNGHEYTVVLIANEHSFKAEYPITVVYKGDNGKIWCKTLENFLAKMVKM